MRKTRLLGLHGLALLGLIGAAAVLATLRGGLWPFDIRATVLMTLSGLAGVALGWGPVWPGVLGASAALPRLWQRVALWPVLVLAMVLLHSGLGPARGFAPLAQLPGAGAGAVMLYAVPVGLMVVLGSALREAFGRNAGA